MAEKRHGMWFHIFDVALNIVIILAVVGIIRTFLISPFQVEGNSMLDTLENRQYILINKLAYHIGKPERGDVVVLHPPVERGKYYVKRVIGIPGDTITIKDGKVFVTTKEGKEMPLEEPYLNMNNQGNTYPAKQNRLLPKTYPVIPEGHYFVMGDNRKNSSDSRGFSATEDAPEFFVPEDMISGRVWYVLLPISKIHAMEKVEY